MKAADPGMVEGVSGAQLGRARELERLRPVDCAQTLGETQLAYSFLMGVWVRDLRDRNSARYWNGVQFMTRLNSWHK